MFANVIKVSHTPSIIAWANAMFAVMHSRRKISQATIQVMCLSLSVSDLVAGKEEVGKDLTAGRLVM